MVKYYRLYSIEKKQNGANKDYIVKINPIKRRKFFKQKKAVEAA